MQEIMWHRSNTLKYDLSLSYFQDGLQTFGAFRGVILRSQLIVLLKLKVSTDSFDEKKIVLSKVRFE